MSQIRNIDIIPDSTVSRIHLSQGDIGRTLIFYLFENALSWSVPASSTIKCQGTKPSGFGFSVNCTYSGNAVTCVTTEGMTDEYGQIEAELLITSSDESQIFGTSNFILDIERNPHPDGTVDGNAENPVIANLNAVITQAVNDWLDEHPEATTTVVDGSITEPKLASALATKINDKANTSALTDEATTRANADTALSNQIAALQGAVGSPLVASTIAGMTDTTKIYVYTGSETGYTAGNWYYYNGSAWVSGGVYNAVAVQTDTTLSVSGMPADAKVVGDEVGDLKSDLGDVKNYVGFNPTASRTIAITTQTYIVAEDSKLAFDASADDTITLNVSGTSFSGTSVALYFFKTGENTGTYSGPITIGADKEVTLEYGISGYGIYTAELTSGNIILTAKKDELKGLNDRITTLETGVSTLNTNIENLDTEVDELKDYQEALITVVRSANLYQGTCEHGYWSGTRFVANETYGSTPSISLKAGTYLFPSSQSVYGDSGKNVIVLDGEGNALSYIVGESVGSKTQANVYNNRDILKFTLSEDSNIAINVGGITGLGTAVYNGNFMLVSGSTISDFPDYEAYFAPYAVLNSTVELSSGMTAQVNGLSGLLGKTAIFDGDSICKGTINGTTPEETNGWAGYIGTANDMTYHNYAVSGGVITSASNQLVSDKHSVVDNIDTMYANYPNADIVVFEGGTNDADRLGNAIADPTILGTYTPLDFSGSYDATTFTGALETIFYKATQYWTGKKIGYIVAQKMGYSTTGFDKDHTNRRAYFERAIEICQKWGIPYLNLWDDACYLNPNNPACYDRNKTKDQNISEGKLYTDGQHLTKKGYEYISSIIEAWMKTI